MAPDVKGNFDAAERRRQMIQESKFLGGDMEHTHLVKGKALKIGFIKKSQHSCSPEVIFLNLS